MPQHFSVALFLVQPRQRNETVVTCRGRADHSLINGVEVEPDDRHMSFPFRINLLNTKTPSRAIPAAFRGGQFDINCVTVRLDPVPQVIQRWIKRLLTGILIQDEALNRRPAPQFIRREAVSKNARHTPWARMLRLDAFLTQGK